MRTKNISSIKNRLGKKVYPILILPEIPNQESDIYIISRDGDTLDGLSDKYYGNTNDYWIIAHANKIGKGSRFIEAGIQLRIPIETESIKRKLIELNER